MRLVTAHQTARPARCRRAELHALFALKAIDGEGAGGVDLPAAILQKRRAELLAAGRTGRRTAGSTATG